MNRQDDLSQTFGDLRDALCNCHVEKLDEIISDNYQGFSLNGTVESKQDILLNFKPGGINLTDYEVSDVEFEVYTEIGIVSGKGFIAGTYEEFSFQHQVLFTDLFKYVNGQWRYYKSQVTEVPVS